MPQVSLPPKLYFRIGEVASLVGVEPHVLRYWEREFRAIRPTKSAKGQRVYSRRDVENLMRVRDLLYADGFTIAGAKKKLQRTGTEPEPEREASRAGAIEPLAQARGGLAPGPALAAAPVPSADPARAVQVERSLSETRSETRSGTSSGNGDAAARKSMHAALHELRSEIEAFLAELGG